MHSFLINIIAEGNALAQPMESIRFDFLEPFPDGVRRLTTANWAGACIVLSRNHIDSAFKVAELTRPGVYILAGPSEVRTDGQPPRLVSKVYIGKSDTLDERLRNHHDSKEFWSTAFAFYSAVEDLHGGQIAQLEALLIERAQAAGNHVANIAKPRQHGKQSESESMKAFASQIETILKALGHDFSQRKSCPDQPLSNSMNKKNLKCQKSSEALWIS